MDLIKNRIYQVKITHPFFPNKFGRFEYMADGQLALSDEDNPSFIFFVKPEDIKGFNRDSDKIISFRYF